MQTIYYSTPHYICHEGNLVDLNEFRRKRSLVQEGSLAPKLEEHLARLRGRTIILPMKKPNWLFYPMPKCPVIPGIRNTPPGFWMPVPVLGW